MAIETYTLKNLTVKLIETEIEGSRLLRRDISLRLDSSSGVITAERMRCNELYLEVKKVVTSNDSEDRKFNTLKSLCCHLAS